MQDLKTFELISSQAPLCIMVFDRNGECLHINETARRLIRDESSVVGRHFQELWHPDFGNEVKGHMDAVLSGKPLEFEAYRPCGDDLQWWASKIVPIHCETHGHVEKFVVFGHNITEQKQMKNQLKQLQTVQSRKDELMNIYDAMLDAVHLTNENYEIELVNKSCEKMFGPAQLNSKCFDYFHGFDEPCPWCRQEEVFQGKSLVTQSLFKKIGRYIESLQSPVKTSDGSRLKLVVLRDITEQKLASEKLQQALSDKENLLREKDLLIREVHHRVSNHLTVMQSLMNLQLQEIGDNAARTCLIESENRIKVISLINEQLYNATDLKNMDAYEYLSVLSNKIFNVLKGKLSSVRLHVEIDPIRLDIDLLTRLGLLLNEMLTNAMKYAFVEKGEGDIWVNLRRVGADIHFSVRDNGVGIAKDSGNSNKQSLGMKLIDLIVGQLDGTLQINSDSGTVIRIEFRERPTKKSR